MESPRVMGPCAKAQVSCRIFWTDPRTGVIDGVLGTNDCANPQPVCPRAPGEGYEKCKTVCRQEGHAEEVALRQVREKGVDLRQMVTPQAFLRGHHYCCSDCALKLRDAGVKNVVIALDSTTVKENLNDARG